MAMVEGKKIATGMVWTSIEMVLKKGVSTIITIILARILSAEDYGMIALTTVFITFAAVFTQNGFAIAIIRKEKVSKEDISTTHIVNIFFAIVVYGILFFSAPGIAVFYNQEKLTSVLRAISLAVIFQAFSATHRAIATRNVNFKILSISSTVSSILSGSIGVLLAYMGFGVWSLVIQQISATLLDAVILTFFVRMDFSFNISIKSFKNMFCFSIGAIGTAFVDFAGNNFASILIGKRLSTEKLGIYNKGTLLPEVIGLNIFNIMNVTLLPALSSGKNERELLKTRIVKYVQLSSYIMFPVMFGLFLVADEAIPVLLTEKWTEAIPIMKCFCIYYMMNPYRAIAYNVLYVLGESQKTFRIECLRCLAMIISAWFVLVLLNGDIFVLAMLTAIETSIVAIGALCYVKSYLKIDGSVLIKDIGKTILLTGVMACIVIMFKYLPVSKLIKFLIEITAGAVGFLVMSAITKNSNYYLMKGYATRYMSKVRGHK